MKRNLILVLSFCHKDKHLAMEQMQFLSEIGFRKSSHGKDRTIILAHCHNSNTSGIGPIVKGMFDKVEEFVPRDSYEHGWPTACNHQFVRCAEHVKNRQCPWLFMEADAVIMNPDFLDVIEMDYYDKGKPFLGRIIRLHNEDTDHLTGISVYPHDVFHHIGKISIGGQAWDYQKRKEILQHAAETGYIQQIWEPKPFNTLLELSLIQEGTRIFHRCKDGTLIKLLRRKRNNAATQVKFLSDDERDILTQLQRENIDLHNKLKEVLDIREGSGKNPRFALRKLDAWIVENRNLI